MLVLFQGRRFCNPGPSGVVCGHDTIKPELEAMQRLRSTDMLRCGEHERKRELIAVETVEDGKLLL